MGHPKFWWGRGCHFSLNLPQASQPLGMKKGEAGSHGERLQRFSPVQRGRKSGSGPRSQADSCREKRRGYLAFFFVRSLCRRAWNQTRVASALGIEYPIIQGPLGGFSSQRLTAAVSNFGGLGSFGAHGLEPQAIADMIAEIRSLTRNHSP